MYPVTVTITAITNKHLNTAYKKLLEKHKSGKKLSDDETSLLKGLHSLHKSQAKARKKPEASQSENKNKQNKQNKQKSGDKVLAKYVAAYKELKDQEATLIEQYKKLSTKIKSLREKIKK